MGGAHQAPSGQGGFALVELTLALLIALLVAVLGMRSWVNQVNDAQARAAAVWMETVHKAVLAYLQRHGPDIQEAASHDALAGAGYQDWRAPTLAELAAAGLLASGMPHTVRLTGGARIHVWRSGECPGDACTVEALIHGEQPLLDAHAQVDEAMVAQWLLAAQGEGAAVHPGEPGRLRGTRFSVNSTLPDGSVLPPGTVGMAVTAEHQALWSYLRVGDRRDPDFQGDLSLAGDVMAGGSGTVGGHLRIGAEAVMNAPCQPDRAIVQRDAGGLLTCRQGRWRPAGQFGGAFAYNHPFGCQNAEGVPTANLLTGGCSCARGTTPIMVYDAGEQAAQPQPGLPFLGRQSVYICIG